MATEENRLLMTRVRQLEGQLSETQVLNHQLQETLTSSQSSCAELRQKLDAKEGELSGMTAQLEKAENDYERLSDEYQTLVESGFVDIAGGSHSARMADKSFNIFRSNASISFQVKDRTDTWAQTGDELLPIPGEVREELDTLRNEVLALRKQLEGNIGGEGVRESPQQGGDGSERYSSDSGDLRSHYSDSEDEGFTVVGLSHQTSRFVPPAPLALKLNLVMPPVIQTTSLAFNEESNMMLDETPRFASLTGRLRADQPLNLTQALAFNNQRQMLSARKLSQATPRMSIDSSRYGPSAAQGSINNSNSMMSPRFQQIAERYAQHTPRDDVPVSRTRRTNETAIRPRRLSNPPQAECDPPATLRGANSPAADPLASTERAPRPAPCEEDRRQCNEEEMIGDATIGDLSPIHPVSRTPRAEEPKQEADQNRLAEGPKPQAQSQPEVSCHTDPIVVVQPPPIPATAPQRKPRAASEIEGSNTVVRLEEPRERTPKTLSSAAPIDVDMSVRRLLDDSETRNHMFSLGEDPACASSCTVCELMFHIQQQFAGRMTCRQAYYAAGWIPEMCERWLLEHDLVWTIEERASIATTLATRPTRNKFTSWHLASEAKIWRNKETRFWKSSWKDCYLLLQGVFLYVFRSNNPTEAVYSVSLVRSARIHTHMNQDKLHVITLDCLGCGSCVGAEEAQPVEQVLIGFKTMQTMDEWKRTLEQLSLTCPHMCSSKFANSVQAMKEICEDLLTQALREEKKIRKAIAAQRATPQVRTPSNNDGAQ